MTTVSVCCPSLVRICRFRSRLVKQAFCERWLAGVHDWYVLRIVMLVDLPCLSRCVYHIILHGANLTAATRVFACMRGSLQNQINPLIRIDP